VSCVYCKYGLEVAGTASLPAELGQFKNLPGESTDNCGIVTGTGILL